MVDMLSHLVMGHADEPCSNLNLLLEIRGQVLRRAHRLLDRGRLVSHPKRLG
jgi:hypothetical protein